MTRIYICAALLAVSLTACDKAPAPAAAASAPPAAPTAPAAAAPPTPSAVVTYQCHSAQKSRDIFVRFDANGTVNMGDNATDMTPTGDVVLFDKNGMASWSKKQGSWTMTNTFDKNKAEWGWTNDPGPTGVADHAQYSCKTI